MCPFADPSYGRDHRGGFSKVSQTPQNSTLYCTQTQQFCPNCHPEATRDLQKCPFPTSLAKDFPSFANHLPSFAKRFPAFERDSPLFAGGSPSFAIHYPSFEIDFPPFAKGFPPFAANFPSFARSPTAFARHSPHFVSWLVENDYPFVDQYALVSVTNALRCSSRRVLRMPGLRRPSRNWTS